MLKAAPRLAGWLAFLLGLGSGAGLRAAPTEARPAPRRARAPARHQVVMMADRSQAAAAQELHRAVAAQLSDAPVRLRVHDLSRAGADLRRELGVAKRLARQSGVIVVFWCDVKGSEDVYLYLSEPGGGRLLVRQVPRAAGAARAESVAIIVGTSVRAFLRHGLRGPLRGAARPAPRARPRPLPRTARPGGADGPDTRPRAAASRARAVARPAQVSLPTPHAGLPVLKQWTRPRPTRLSLILSYSVDSYNQHAGALHGANLSVSYRFTPRWSVFAAFRVMQSIKGRKTDPSQGVDVSVTLQRYPIALGGGIHWNIGRFRLGGTLAFVLDYVAVEARNETESGPGLEVYDDRGDWHYFVSPELQVGFRIVRRLWICMAFGAELLLYSKKYTVDDAATGQPIDVLMPWYVQPYARLGVRLDLF